MTEVENSQFGVNLWWTVPEFVTDGDRAQEIVSANGFEPEKDMPLPSRRNEVSRAAYSFQDRRHKNGRKVTEKIDRGNSVVYGILSQHSEGAEKVAYTQDTTVRMDKDSGRVEAEGPQTEDFFEALERYSGSITDDDVRQFLRKVVRMCYGVAKRPSGGIYFIPERFAGIVESAQRILDELNVGAKLYVERVMNGEQERQIVWEAVETDIESQIEQTLKAVGRIEKRVSSIESHEAKIGELTSLMDIYKGLLGQEAKYEELSEKLKDASSEVAAKLAELQSEAKSRGSKKKASRKSGSIGQQAVDAALNALMEAGKPMHYRDIARKAEEAGLELRGNDGATWLNSWICETFRDGAESPFKRIGRGVYGLASE